MKGSMRYLGVMRGSGSMACLGESMGRADYDIDGFLGASDVVGARLAAAKCQPPGTLLGVSKLAFPGLMIEMEATAAK